MQCSIDDFVRGRNGVTAEIPGRLRINDQSPLKKKGVSDERAGAARQSQRMNFTNKLVHGYFIARTLQGGQRLLQVSWQALVSLAQPTEPPDERPSISRVNAGMPG